MIPLRLFLGSLIPYNIQRTDKKKMTKDRQEEEDDDKAVVPSVATAIAALGSIRFLLVLVKEEKEVQNQYCMELIFYFKSNQ